MKKSCMDCRADKDVKKLLAKMLVLKAHEKICVESI